MEIEVAYNPLDWVGAVTCYAYLQPIIKIFKVINCSVNYFAYRFILFKENKEEELRQKNQQKTNDIPMVSYGSYAGNLNEIS